MKEIDRIFSRIPDPRQPWKIKHELSSILLICILGVLANANSSYEISVFAQLREGWLKQILPLPNGLPSRLTIERVLRLMSPSKFELAFQQVMELMRDTSNGRIIAVDGKACFNRKSGSHNILYMVGAWCSTNGLSLGQIETVDKSNEITAIPDLLELIDIRGGIVTIDAIGCQKAIVKKIVQKKGDYVIGLKKNQQQLYKDCADYCLSAISDPLFKDTYETHTTLDKGHGRIEKRKYYLFHDLSWLQQQKQWANLQGFLMVESERQVGNKAPTMERRFYITSLKDIAMASFAARKHWGIENTLHWTLDVVFKEDDWHTKKENAAANLSRIRRLTANILKVDRYFPEKMTTPIRRYVCCADPNALPEVISSNPFFS